ncbi:hypothetical protein Tco_0389210 [Tanacetum coccineum]
MSMQGVENTEDALISIIKSIKKDMKDDIMKKQIEASTANISNETSSIANNEVDTNDDNTSTTVSCLLPKELSPGSFLLPFNINNHSLYAINTLDAKDNIIPLNVYEYLGLDEFKVLLLVYFNIGVNTATNGIDVYATCVWFLVKRRINQHVLIDKETAVEILVLLDLRGRISIAGYEVSTASFILSTAYEYLVLSSYISTTSCMFILPMTVNTASLIFEGRLVLPVHVNAAITKETGRENFKFNINSHQCVEKSYMVDTGQEEETFDPLKIGMDLFSYKSPACLEFEQRTRSYGTSNLQDEIAKPISFLPDKRGLVKRWHVCKPIHVTYDDGNGKDCGMWPTCDIDSKFCFGYNEVFGVNEQGALRMWICFRDHERRTMKESYIGFADFLQLPIRPRLCNYSFEEWLKIRIGHNNLHESDREFIFNEWILDSYDVEEEYAREIGDPYSRIFDEYNREDEMWRITDYDPPYVNIETFEGKNFSFKGGRSFICITNREDEALPLGCVNGERFKAMIRKELEGHKIQKLGGNYRDRLDSYSFGNLVEFAAIMT